MNDQNAAPRFTVEPQVAVNLLQNRAAVRELQGQVDSLRAEARKAGKAQEHQAASYLNGRANRLSVLIREVEEESRQYILTSAKRQAQAAFEQFFAEDR